MGVDEHDRGHDGIVAHEACLWAVTVNKATADWARPVVHWEIEARDPERQKAFYGELFNWNIGDGFIMNIEAGLGGPEPGPAGHLRQSDRSGVTLYVQVRDLRETLDKAVVLGGSVIAEPFDVPGGPTLAGVLDPEGNPLTLVQQ
jgi:predicted enzyme related to lactoylglutathione lyase